MDIKHLHSGCAFSKLILLSLLILSLNFGGCHLNEFMKVSSGFLSCLNKLNQIDLGFLLQSVKLSQVVGGYNVIRIFYGLQRRKIMRIAQQVALVLINHVGNIH